MGRFTALYREEERPLNVAEIVRVFHHVEEDHRRLKMSIWVQKETVIEKVFRKVVKWNPGNYPDCGTRACFAGWTLVLNKVPLKFSAGGYLMDDTVSNQAGQILGLNVRQRLHLFHEHRSYDDSAKQVEDLRNRINEVFEAEGLLVRV